MIRALPRFPSLVAGAILTLAAAGSGATDLPLPPPGQDVVGASVRMRTVYEDTFAAVAERANLGYRELRQANPEVDPWLPGDGTEIVLPSEFVLPPGPRSGVVVNVAEYRLYFYPEDGGVVQTVPVGIGREGFPTPVMESRVVQRLEQPSWTPPESVRQEYAARGVSLSGVVPPGPDNPLGEYAMQLHRPSYLIHGTNQAFGVGSRVSHGCIRLYPEDIARLIWAIPRGAPVRIVHEPFKVGVRGSELVLEAHPPLPDYEGGALTDMVARVIARAPEGAHVDWELAERVAREARGVPVVIGELPEGSVVAPVQMAAGKVAAQERALGE
ncbi:MAG: L,D-transpeptidase family protein [Pseudomonadales bacterium]|nr:L,D-transpeptidase family protein [Pseudomonadales bacterium]